MTDTDKPPPQAGSRAASWVTFVWAVAVTVGVVWIWLTTDGDDLLVHIAVTVIFGLAWTAIVMVVLGVLGLILGVGAALTIPFRKRP